MSGSGMIAGARNISTERDERAAAYIHRKADAWKNMGGKRGVTVAEGCLVARALRACAEEIAQGFHFEGED